MNDLKQLSIALVLDVTKSRAELSSFATELKGLDNKVGAGVGPANAHLDSMSTKLHGAAQAAGQVGDKLSLGVTLPLVAAGTAAVKLSNDFDQAFARMVGLADVPRSEIDGLKQSVLDLAGKTGQAPVDLANGLYFIESAGIHGKTALEALEVSARGAAAGLGDSAAVADALTSAISAYGEANLTAAKAGDVLAATAREGKAEAAQLAPEFGRLLPAATALGISFDQVGAGLAFLSRSSGDAALSATQLNGVMMAMLSPSQQAAKLLGDVGLSTAELQKVVKDQGLLAALQLLQEKFKGNSEMMAQFFADNRALNGAILLTKDGGKDAAEVFDHLAHSTGSMGEAFDAVAGGDSFKLKQAFAELQVQLIKMGEAIAPFVTMIVTGVSTVASAFGALPGPVKDVLLVFAALIAATGPLLSMFGRVSQFVSLVGKSLDALKGLGAANRLAELGPAASNSATGVASLYQSSGRLSSTLGKAGLVGALAGAGFALYEYGQSLNKTKLDSDDLSRITKLSADKMVGFMDELAAKSKGPFAHMFDDAINDLVDRGPEGIGVLQQYRDHVAAMGGDTSKLDAALAGAAASQQNLTTNTEIGNKALGDAAGSTDQLKEATQKATEQEQALAAAHLGLVQMTDQLAGAFDKQYQALVGPTKLLSDYEASIDDLTASLHKNGTTLDLNTEKGRSNTDAVLKAGESIAKLIEQKYNETHSVKEATEMGQFYVDNLRKQLTQAGYTKDQVQSLIDTMHLTPEDISTTFSTNGLEAQVVVGKYLASLDKIPPEVQTEIETALKQGDIDAASAILDWVTRRRQVDITINPHIYGGGTFVVGAAGNQRWGGIVNAYGAGGIHAHVATREMIRYAEPETGGEAFVPRFGEYNRSMAVMNEAARWYGARVMPLQDGGIIYPSMPTVGVMPSATVADSGWGAGDIVLSLDGREFARWRRDSKRARR